MGGVALVVVVEEEEEERRVEIGVVEGRMERFDVVRRVKWEGREGGRMLVT